MLNEQFNVFISTIFLTWFFLTIFLIFGINDFLSSFSQKNHVCPWKLVNWRETSAQMLLSLHYFMFFHNFMPIHPPVEHLFLIFFFVQGHGDCWSLSQGKEWVRVSKIKPTRSQREDASSRKNPAGFLNVFFFLFFFPYAHQINKFKGDGGYSQCCLWVFFFLFILSMWPMGPENPIQ